MVKLTAFPGGIEELIANITELSKSKKMVLVGIAGPTGAGKTFIARKLPGILLSTDRYYKPIKNLLKGNWDDPNSLYLRRLQIDLTKLKKGAPVKIPIWNYITHSRNGFEVIYKPKIMLLEGLHALHPKISNLLDLKVFVECNKKTRLCRILKRNKKERGGWTKEGYIKYFNEISEIMTEKHISPMKARADILIINNKEARQ